EVAGVHGAQTSQQPVQRPLSRRAPILDRRFDFDRDVGRGVRGLGGVLGCVLRGAALSALPTAVPVSATTWNGSLLLDEGTFADAHGQLLTIGVETDVHRRLAGGRREHSFWLASDAIDLVYKTDAGLVRM